MKNSILTEKLGAMSNTDSVEVTRDLNRLMMDEYKLLSEENLKEMENMKMYM